MYHVVFVSYLYPKKYIGEDSQRFAKRHGSDLRCQVATVNSLHHKKGDIRVAVITIVENLHDVRCGMAEFLRNKRFSKEMTSERRFVDSVKAGRQNGFDDNVSIK